MATIGAGDSATQPGSGHIPILAEVVARELITNQEGIYCDVTIGGGGHAEVIINHLHQSGRLIGLDRDPQTAANTAAALQNYGDRVSVVHADYRNLAGVLRDAGIAKISGALFDLGLSSIQLDNPARGFAYMQDGPLDMRFDTSCGETAAEWLADAAEEEIARVLYEFGEERHSRRIAKLIVAKRATAAIETTGALIAILRKVARGPGRILGRTAARVFQALRIVVNDELSAIPIGLNAVIDHLEPGGRVVVIAYHSLEDRLVKNLFREASRLCRCALDYGGCICGADPKGRLVHRRVIRASAEEVTVNPRAKSARLRVFEKDVEVAR